MDGTWKHQLLQEFRGSPHGNLDVSGEILAIRQEVNLTMVRFYFCQGMYAGTCQYLWQIFWWSLMRLEIFLVFGYLNEFTIPGKMKDSRICTAYCSRDEWVTNHRFGSLGSHGALLHFFLLQGFNRLCPWCFAFKSSFRWARMGRGSLETLSND